MHHDSEHNQTGYPEPFGVPQLRLWLLRYRLQHGDYPSPDMLDGAIHSSYGIASRSSVTQPAARRYFWRIWLGHELFGAGYDMVRRLSNLSEDIATGITVEREKRRLNGKRRSQRKPTFGTAGTIAGIAAVVGVIVFWPRKQPTTRG
jgi:hypothetical protein